MRNFVSVRVWAGAFVFGLIASVPFGTGSAAIAQQEKVEAKQDLHPAVKPVDRKAKWWQQRHKQKVDGIKKNQDLQLLFIGDSITHGFEGKGKEVWNKYYKPRKAFNIGFSGDRTEHVLWRFDHGELEGIHPKLAVIMIGTNNTGHRKDPSEKIAEGIQKILQKLKEKCPKTKVLLLGIFPRSAKPTDRMRKINDGANKLIAKFENKEKGIFYLNINKKFLDDEGTLPKSIMPDLLHPNNKGYEIWAEAIEPKIKQLMGEK